MMTDMKWTWRIFGVWCAVVLFVPMVHYTHVPLELYSLTAVMVFVPWVALSLTIYLHYKRDSFLRSLITVDIATGVVLLLIVCLILYLVVTNVRTEGLAWSYVNTVVTALFVVLLLMRRYLVGVNESEAVLMSVIAGAAFVGISDIPCLLTLPSYNHSFLIQEFLVSIPFVLTLCILRPTRYTALSLAVLIGMWFAWVFLYGRWDVITSITSGEPVQWIPYHLYKGTKLVTALLFCSLNIKSMAVSKVEIQNFL